MRPNHRTAWQLATSEPGQGTWRAPSRSINDSRSFRAGQAPTQHSMPSTKSRENQRCHMASHIGHGCTVTLHAVILLVTCGTGVEEYRKGFESRFSPRGRRKRQVDCNLVCIVPSAFFGLRGAVPVWGCALLTVCFTQIGFDGLRYLT
jgi:hypothetical protein